MPNNLPPAEHGTHRDELPYFAGRKTELIALRKRLGRLCSTGDPRGLAALRVLHEGDHGCPILIVGIGLQHTPTVLAGTSDTPGISRLAQIIHLRPLPDDDALDAIKGNMQALGHGIPEACAEALSKASQGFPQHIHGYLAAALQAIDEHGPWTRGRRCNRRCKLATKREPTTTTAACACCRASSPCRRWPA